MRLIALDYVQLMFSERRYASKADETAYISSQIKALARELQTPVLAAAQLNRGSENSSDKRPRLSNLKESGALEQDADVAIFIYRDEYDKRERSEEPNVAEIDLAKNRHGPTGTVKMFWDGPLMQFRALEEEYPLGKRMKDEG